MSLALLLGKRIKAIRLSKGLRQEDMEGFGINIRYFQKIEAGKANITLSTIERIAAAFDVSVEELFCFGLSADDDANKLISLVGKIIDDKDKVKKLNVIIENAFV